MEYRRVLDKASYVTAYIIPNRAYCIYIRAVIGADRHVLWWLQSAN